MMFVWGLEDGFYGHLLLKIIFSMKRCYMGFGGFVEKCVGFVCVLF